MMWALTTVILGSLATVVAQTSSPAAACIANTTDYKWSYNRLGQSPCEIASALGEVCNPAGFIITALQPGSKENYDGPTLETADACRCNTVFYSMLSACANCQDNLWTRWSFYSTNCSSVYSMLFPRDIPSGTAIPHYAYLNVTEKDVFNATIAAADAAANPPESTSIPISTSTSSGISATRTDASSSLKSSNAGAIAGGVVGGFAFIALVAALAFWILRRRHTSMLALSRRRESILAPSKEYEACSPPPMSYSDATSGLASVDVPPKPYNPSDPSTFPSSMTTFNTPSLNTGLQSYGSSQPNINLGTRYTGVPEL